MGAQGSDGVPKKQPPRAVVRRPLVQTDVVRKLQEKQFLQKTQDLGRDFERTIKHIDEVSELSHENSRRQNAYLDAAKTGNDPKINELAKKKAEVAHIPKKAKKMDCSGGVCRIVPKKKK